MKTAIDVEQLLSKLSPGEMDTAYRILEKEFMMHDETPIPLAESRARHKAKKIAAMNEQQKAALKEGIENEKA